MPFNIREAVLVLLSTCGRATPPTLPCPGGLLTAFCASPPTPFQEDRPENRLVRVLGDVRRATSTVRGQLTRHVAHTHLRSPRGPRAARCGSSKTRSLSPRLCLPALCRPRFPVCAPGFSRPPTNNGRAPVWLGLPSNFGAPRDDTHVAEKLCVPFSAERCSQLGQSSAEGQEAEFSELSQLLLRDS